MFQHDRLIVGIVRDGGEAFKKLFSASHLGLLNKATIRAEANTLSFYWLPYCQKTFLPVNDWAMDAIYVQNAEIIRDRGWALYDEIRGPIVIKRSETSMPSVTIATCSAREEAERMKHARSSLSGFWHIVQCPLTSDRRLFAEERMSLIKGQMIFGLTG